MQAEADSDLNLLAADAAELVERSDAIVVAAGAGMGVDSGLPDFRGTEGFWKSYPALARSGIEFHAIASPKSFARDPRLAWGFYGHRLALYRATAPHDGFRMLREWGARTLHGCGVFTSNVDGQFQYAGFEAARILECHGSIHHLQCSRPCCAEIWPADSFEPEVDEDACELRNAPPLCPHCGALARPNVLMFGDWDWIEDRTAQQQRALDVWLDGAERPLVIEIGAGTAIPSVRHFTHRVLLERNGRVIRINPRDAAVPTKRDIAMGCSAARALRAIDVFLR
jgi:NAD-dependent SIR2 family protein deacetylase